MELADSQELQSYSPEGEIAGSEIQMQVLNIFLKNKWHQVISVLQAPW